MIPGFKPRIGLWDPRPRFLGMFQNYKTHPQEKALLALAPAVGILDHLVHCDCGHKANIPHPKFHAAAVYVRIGDRFLSVSWPTWLPL